MESPCRKVPSTTVGVSASPRSNKIGAHRGEVHYSSFSDKWEKKGIYWLKSPERDSEILAMPTNLL